MAVSKVITPVPKFVTNESAAAERLNADHIRHDELQLFCLLFSPSPGESGSSKSLEAVCRMDNSSLGEGFGKRDVSLSAQFGAGKSLEASDVRDCLAQRANEGKQSPFREEGTACRLNLNYDVFHFVQLTKLAANSAPHKACSSQTLESNDCWFEIVQPLQYQTNASPDQNPSDLRLYCNVGHLQDWLMEGFDRLSMYVTRDLGSSHSLKFYDRKLA
jgi:hypothetical protein